jgi:hypothetical protein
LMQATAIALFIGQTSILVFFGFAAMIFGILKERPLSLVVGLTFLALKPQVGIVAFLAVAAHHRDRWTILPAAGICLLATTPIAFSGNYFATVEDFLLGLPSFSRFVGNTPPNMTGLINISDFALPNFEGLPLSLMCIVAAIIFAIIIFHNLSSKKEAEIGYTQQLLAGLMLFVSSTLFLLPLHSYDLVALSILLMMILAIPVAGRYLIAFGLLICFRPRNLLHAFGIANPKDLAFPESHLVSAGLLLLFVGTLWAMRSCRIESRVSIVHCE